MGTISHDLIIIGGGPAGLSAALYASRSLLDAVTLEREAIGGQMMLTSDVDNYPGVPSANAFDLVDAMRSQAEGLGARIEMATVTSIEHDAKTSLFRVSTPSDEYLAPSVVAALGARPRPAGFMGERKFTGRGVSYCATCDGMFYRNKHVERPCRRTGTRREGRDSVPHQHCRRGRRRAAWGHNLQGQRARTGLRGDVRRGLGRYLCPCGSRA